jgi:hypothetical protein
MIEASSRKYKALDAFGDMGVVRVARHRSH